MRIVRSTAPLLLVAVSMLASSCGQTEDSLTDVIGTPTTTVALAATVAAPSTTAVTTSTAPSTAAAPSTVAPTTTEIATTTAAPTTTAPTTTAPTTTAAPAGDDCIIRLHGKGEQGATTSTDSAGNLIVGPEGNGHAWGGLQWEYATSGSYSTARGIVASAADAAGCARIAVHGFSNGASFAAKLYCSGENFGGRLVGVVIDDPVTDASAAGCAPGGGVAGAVYWTGQLEDWAPIGTSCSSVDWTCEGDSVMGIDAYAALLGLNVQASPHSSHTFNLSAPEPAAWLS